MRSWIADIVPLALVVTIVALCNHGASGPSERSFHCDQSPATASGSPSTRWMKCGRLAGLPAFVIGPPSTPAAHS